MNPNITLTQRLQTMAETFVEKGQHIPLQDAMRFKKAYEKASMEQKMDAFHWVTQLEWHTTMEQVYDSVYMPHTEWHEVMSAYFSDPTIKPLMFQAFQNNPPSHDDVRAIMTMHFAHEEPQALGVDRSTFKTFLYDQLSQLSPVPLSKILNVVPLEKDAYPLIENMLKHAQGMTSDAQDIQSNLYAYLDPYLWQDEWKIKDGATADELTQQAQAWYLEVHRMMEPYDFYDMILDGICVHAKMAKVMRRCTLEDSQVMLYQLLAQQTSTERLTTHFDAGENADKSKHLLFDFLSRSQQEHFCYHPLMQAYTPARMMADQLALQEAVAPYEIHQPHAKPRII